MDDKLARRRELLIWPALIAAVAAYGLITAFAPPTSSGAVDFANLGELLAASGAALACLARTRAQTRLHAAASADAAAHDEQTPAVLASLRHARLAWALLSAGIACWAGGQLITCVYEVALATHVPEPSAADAGFLFGYAFIIVGMLAFVRTPAGLLSHLRGAAEALFIACGCLLCSWSLVIAGVFAGGGEQSFASLVNLSYPVLDAVVLATVLFVALQRSAEPPRGLALLALGIALWAVSDSGWWYLGETTGSPGVTPVETGWVAGFALIALGALRHGDRPSAIGRRIASSRSVLMIHAIPALLGVAIVSLHWIVAGSVPSAGVTLALAMAAAALGVVLLLIVTFENHALTRDLERRVQHRTAQLHATESYYRALVQRSSDVVMVVDEGLRIRYVSDSAQDVFGVPAADILGSELETLGGEASEELIRALERVSASPHALERVEWSIADATGRRRRIESTVANLLEERHVRGFVVNSRDDTRRAELADQLRSQALQDPLTGLANRALLGDRASQAYARSLRAGGSMAVMAIDLDSFKLVNDGFGHQCGDAMLCEAARRLNGALRPQDTLARIGGDEFVVLMDQAPAPEEALELAERLLDVLRADVVIGENSHRMTASIGLAAGLAPHTSFDDLLRDADFALYSAKHGGKDAAVLFRPSMNGNARERFELQRDLRRAIDAGELRLHYQPEVDANDGTLDGFEALVRWQHPVHGMLSPDRFIPLAEETGLIVALGRWVLEEAFEQSVRWRDEGLSDRPLNIAVNVSAVQLRSPTIIADVERALDRSGIDPALVMLEVTESAFIDGSEAVVETLLGLKALGVRLALDDFGTGYASLSNLQNMPIDVLKVDRSFLLSSQESSSGNDLLEAIVNIGHVLSLVTIAEGVEHSGQLDAARAFGCELAQGYLFGRPMPAADAALLISGGALGAAGHAPEPAAERQLAAAVDLQPPRRP